MRRQKINENCEHAFKCLMLKSAILTMVVIITKRKIKQRHHQSAASHHRIGKNPKKEKYINGLLGEQNKPTMVNELTLGNNNLICPEDIAEGFNEYFSNIGPDLSSEIDPSNYNFGTISKMLNQSLLRSNILLSTKSLIFCMHFLAIKPLVLIRFLAKLVNLLQRLSQTH